MDAAPEQKTFAQKLQEKIAQSRFFTFSLLLHVVIVVIGGGAVLFHKASEAPDFTSEGGDLLSADASVQAPVEQPPDMTPNQTVTPDAPSITKNPPFSGRSHQPVGAKIRLPSSIADERSQPPL